MLPWIERPVVELDLDLPVGELIRSVPPEVFESGQGLLAALRQEIPPGARWLAPLLRLRTLNRFQREAALMAGAVGARWEELMVANAAYDLKLLLLGCSTIALATPDGPVLARNMDWPMEGPLARASYLFHVRRGGAWRLSNAGWPGAIGVVTGLSAAGFALVLNAVFCKEKFLKTGYPVLFHLRRVLEDAAGFDQAVEMVANQRLFAPALVTIVGRENSQRVVVERTPRHAGLRWAEGDAPLLATNHYRALESEQRDALDELLPQTCLRYGNLCRAFAADWPVRQIADEELLYVLSDPGVIQTITAQHIVIRPRKETMRLFVPRRLSAAGC